MKLNKSLKKKEEKKRKRKNETTQNCILYDTIQIPAATTSSVTCQGRVPCLKKNKKNKNMPLVRHTCLTFDLYPGTFP